ncbi:MAG: FAD-binding protein [Thermoleophilaceae bacterium]|nr:FAD-binding protein [Thermoleophilaceae bacterium]
MSRKIEHSLSAEVVVIGAGAAGLYCALTAAKAGARVALIAQAQLATTASYWAQGGIAAALASDDSPQLHQADTLAAGRALGRPSAASVLTQNSPQSVHDLQNIGVQFDQGPDGQLLLGLEGGHSRRRVAHAGGSATGRRIARELSARVAEHPLVTVIENASAKQLVEIDGRCTGAVVEIDGRRRVLITGRSTVLATGGAAALWSRSTNPPAAVGAGLAMAHAAGAAVADLEFLQFHPTALASTGRNQGFLISEAIRGEGARIVDQEGQQFVDELAPRDEVALAIEHERNANGDGTLREVFIDMREIEPVAFPNVFKKIGEAGFDPSSELIPVAPAAHYSMGGVVTDLDARSTLPGLLAIGECACNGLHGANRLASNSLAECLVFGRRAALAALSGPAPPANASQVAQDVEPDVAHDPDPAATRDLMWRCAGLERDGAGLKELLNSDSAVARLVGRCALAREESRGAHRRSDFPQQQPQLDLHHSVVDADDSTAMIRWE